MNNLRAILVEDEPSGMDNLRYKIQNNCPEVEIVAECASGAEAVQAILRHLPDVLFLDIRLGDMTGFDVLKAIRHPSFEVIFTTSYDEYAIEAIKNNALDYLVKPIMVDELLEAVAKARMKMIRSSSQPQQTASTSSSSNKFGFPITTGMQFVELDEVVYAKAENNAAEVVLTNNKTIKLTRTLGWLEEELQDRGFCRVHNSYLINFQHLNEYIRNEGGFVVMSNKKAISISRRRKDAFLEQMEEWQKGKN
jgi:two-component system LytT family response regulator